MSSDRLLRRLMLLSSVSAVAAWLAACSSPPKPTITVSKAPAPPPPAPEPPVVVMPPPQPVEPEPAKVSVARNARDYRRDAASHLYALNSSRIYSGKLPPMLYAVGVLQVELDRRGNVLHLDWMRAPRHAPEVMAEIERTVRQAAPFPAPMRMGRVTYTDTWLWHKSGRFQLDTLTEGQASA